MKDSRYVDSKYACLNQDSDTVGKEMRYERLWIHEGIQKKGEKINLGLAIGK